MTIDHRHTDNTGAFLAMESDQLIGEMVYSVTGPARIIIEQTEGFPGSEGKGVGMKLLDAAIAYARKNKLRVSPLCPFALKMMDRRKEEYADVRA